MNGKLSVPHESAYVERVGIVGNIKPGDVKFCWPWPLSPGWAVELPELSEFE